MQTHGGAAATAAIEGQERRFRSDILVDWARDGEFLGPMADLSEHVDDISVNRELEGLIPSEISITEGSAAAELTVVLSGEDPDTGLSMVQIFSEFNSASPLYGQELLGAEVSWDVWAETSEGQVRYRQFIGNVRTITPDRADGTVTITALDRADKLRQPVTLPPWAYSLENSKNGQLLAQLQNSQGVIDAALRYGGTSPTPYVPPTDAELGVPAPETGVGFWLTGTSSVPLVGYWDEVQRSTYFDTEGTGVQMFGHYGATHPDSPQPNIVPLGIQSKGLNSSNLYYRVRDSFATPFASAHYMGFTLLTGDGTYWQTASDKLVYLIEIESSVTLQIWIGVGQLWARWVRESDGTTRETRKVAIPTGAPYQRVNVLIYGQGTPGTVRAIVRVGSNTTGDVYVGGRPTSVATRPSRGRILLRDYFGIQDVYYISRWTANPAEQLSLVNKPAPYAAVLDPGLHRMSHYPVVKAEDGWDLVKEVAGAELGSAFWDENGVFHFWNRQTLVAKQGNTVRTVTADELTGLSMVRSIDALRNELSVATAHAVASSWRSVYEAQDIYDYAIPPETQRDFVVQLDDIIAADDSMVTRYTTVSGNGLPSWNQYVKHGYVVQWYGQVNGSGPAVWAERTNFTSGVDITAKVEVDGYLRFSIWNGYTMSMRLATNNEEPALRIGGNMRVVYDDFRTSYKDEPSISEFGTRNYDVSSRWIQYASGANTFTNYMLPRLSRTASVADNTVSMPGDPRIQLGDTLAVEDGDGFGSGFGLQVVGITREFNEENGLLDTYTVEVVQM